MDEREFKKWFEEAGSTIKAIDSDLRDGNFNWACFKAQQASEFALKAILWGCGKPAFGHSLGLLEKLESFWKIPEKIREYGARLDKFYVPTRYANQWLEKPPHAFFTKKEAEEAKKMSKDMLNFIKKCWISLKKEEKRKKG